MLDVTAGADDPGAHRQELVLGMAGSGRPETAAAAAAVATLLGDDELRRRVRREVAESGLVLPRWLAELHRTEALGRAVEISTVYRDADQLLVGATVPGGYPLTAVVLVDNELGAFAADGFVVEARLDDVAAIALADVGEDACLRDIPPADARARIEAAVRELDLGPGTGGYESWAQSRPLVTWVVGLQPAGGSADALQELSEDELDDITDSFLASPFGPAWAGADLRPLVDEVVTAGSANGIGDPLVWSPDNVRKLLTPEFRMLDDSTPFLHRVPELLRDLIRYGHAERGLRPGLTAAALSALDAAAGSFLAAVQDLDANES
ncbi:hypothetical protein SAMN06272739_4191 [Blastococcus haudaquaticus]|uniref:Uncharacterized protein n=2 Tax=Blastococcus haudaquaticus TaxID=1938745 RepID=A0A286H7M2_9ACTN|nr:hypothetical protein SAMN06272739_4191 [Blastococcus haudaquaticus]